MVNVDDMPAGRELDALVAEKVFGCAPKMSPVAMDCHCTCPGGPHDQDNEHSSWLAFYSTDIAAAWEVLRHLASLRIGPEKHPSKDGRSALYKPVFRIEAYEHDDEYEVRIGRCKSVGMDDDIVCCESGGDFDTTIPLLICRAALKAVQ